MNFSANNFKGNFQQVWNPPGAAAWLRTQVESMAITIRNLNAIIARLKAQKA